MTNNNNILIDFIFHNLYKFVLIACFAQCNTP